MCLEFFLSCFSHNVFQEGCDCNWSGGAGLVEPGAEQEEQEEEEEEEKEEEEKEEKEEEEKEEKEAGAAFTELLLQPPETELENQRQI